MPVYPMIFHLKISKVGQTGTNHASISAHALPVNLMKM